ncbi:hypothetical protein BDY24DRAFT_418236 [Mrakia frigida]|uniref:uncharacterized protein n=1 Tax=Mrakia frigida TaxID=29902 RepID=UPI003FCBFC96
MYTPSLESPHQQRKTSPQAQGRRPRPILPPLVSTSTPTSTSSPSILSPSSSSSYLYGQHVPPSSPSSLTPSRSIYGVHHPGSRGGGIRSSSASSPPPPPPPPSSSSPSSASNWMSSSPSDSRIASVYSFGYRESTRYTSPDPRTRNGTATAEEAEENEAQRSSFSSSSSSTFPPPLPPPPPPPPTPPIGPNRTSMSSSYSRSPLPPTNHYLASPPPSPPRPSTSSSSPTSSVPPTPTPARSILEQGEEEELQRVLELSKLTHRSETVSRTWEDGVELELDAHEREIQEARKKEEEDLKRAMEESLRISSQRGGRSGWVGEEFWGQRSPRSPVASSSPTPPQPQPFPRSPPNRQSSRPLPIAPPSPTSPHQSLPHPHPHPPSHSYSFPNGLVATTSARPSSSFAPPTSSASRRQPIYSRAVSLPASSSSAPYVRTASTRRTTSSSLFLANPSSDTPLPDLVEAAYANKGASELYNASVLPTIRGETWEGTSAEASGSSSEAAPRVQVQNDQDALDEDGLLRDVALSSDLEDEEENRSVVLEPDEEEIELQRRRREEMRRESFVGGEGMDASLLGAGEGRGAPAGLRLADFSRRLSGGSAILENEELVGGGTSSVSIESNWGGLGWGHTTLSPPIQANAAPLTLHPLPPSPILPSIAIPPKSQGTFYIKAPSYGTLLSGLFTQANTTIIGSGSYHLAVQFVKLSTPSSSFASSTTETGEFSTILWLEDAGEEPSGPLSPNSSPHALTGHHNGFRSSVFHPTTMNPNLPIYVPSPSHLVKTSSNLIHTTLLQPINSQRYNSAPPPQAQHTTLLAIPPCQPPTTTINQLVNHLLALTSPTPQTKAISRRLNTIVAQYTGGSSSSSSGGDFYPPVAPSTSLISPSGGGLLDDGPSSSSLAVGGGATEDWYDDADDRVLGGGSGGVKSWLKHKKTMVVSKAAGRAGRSTMMGKKSETLAAASFITPFSIPVETTTPEQQHQQQGRNE